MALQRRRHSDHRSPRPSPSLSALAAAVLLSLLLLLFFFAPSPLPTLLVKDALEIQTNAVEDAGSFRVPVHVSIGGGSARNDLWRSSSAKFYHGCSNSSKSFASAEDITIRNRYLVIATSGGLNQQRMGVKISYSAQLICNVVLVIVLLFAII